MCSARDLGHFARADVEAPRVSRFSQRSFKVELFQGRLLHHLLRRTIDPRRRIADLMAHLTVRLAI
jgi:hypothetical protein